MRFIRYYIRSYIKEEQNFLARLNSIDHTYGNTHEPYKLTLRCVMWPGIKLPDMVLDRSFPGGFDHKRQLVTGREFVFGKRKK